MNIFFSLMILLVPIIGCQNSPRELESIFPFLEKGQGNFSIWKTTPEPESRILGDGLTVEFFFNEAFSKEMCRRSVRFSVPLPFRLETQDKSLVWISERELPEGSYTITIGSTCEDMAGRNLTNDYSFPFFVKAKPEPLPEPEPVLPPEPVLHITAMGVGSQNCGNRIPEKGNPNGGDWNSASCFWDQSLPMLLPGNYRFRGGDLGTGSFGSEVGCSDSNTDNFVVQFSHHVSLSEIWEKARLEKLTPPTAVVRLVRVLPKFCNESSVTFCRQFTLLFAEQEASCNGSIFGRNGDFNLGDTRNSPDGQPLYRISFSKVKGITDTGILVEMKEDFKFIMEGK